MACPFLAFLQLIMRSPVRRCRRSVPDGVIRVAQAATTGADDAMVPRATSRPWSPLQILRGAPARMRTGGNGRDGIRQSFQQVD